MPTNLDTLTDLELHCLAAVGAGGCLTRADLRIFLGPQAVPVIDGLINAGLLSEASHDAALVLPSSETAASAVVDLLNSRGPVSKDRLEILLTQLRQWMIEQQRSDAVIRLLPWISVDDIAIGYLLEHGRQVCGNDPDAVLAAIRHISSVHDGPLCAAVSSVLVYALDASARSNEAVACASKALAAGKEAAPCRHEMTVLDTAALALWLAQRRTSRVEDAISQAEAALASAPPVEKSRFLGARPENQIDLLIEMFLAQCWATDLSGARQSLAMLQEQVALDGQPRLTGVVYALRGWYRCLAGDLVAARHNAVAALESRNLEPRFEYVARTVLAWVALSNVETSMLDEQLDANQFQPLTSPPASGFLNTARSLSLVQSRGLDLARDAVRYDLQIMPSRTTLARCLRLTAVADLAWIAGDTRELRSLRRELRSLHLDGEAGMITARLSIDQRHGDVEVRAALGAPDRPALPFTRLRVMHAAAEHLWISGQDREADHMLTRIVEVAERQLSVRFTRDMFLRRPDWALQLKERLTVIDAPIPRWLPVPDGGQSSGAETDASHHNGAGPLSVAELRVLSEMAAGFTAGESAERLFLSPHTVRTHHKAIYRKLGVHRRAEAIAYGRARGWF